MANKDLHDWLWKIGSELHQLSGEMAKISPKLAKGKCWEPRIDLFDTPNFVVIKAEIAGVQREEIDVIFNNEKNSITIKGTRFESDTIEQKHSVHHLEIFYGEFEREIQLPDIPVEIERAQILYNNGFLSILIPKDQKKIKTIYIERIYTIKDK